MGHHIQYMCVRQGGGVGGEGVELGGGQAEAAQAGVDVEEGGATAGFAPLGDLGQGAEDGSDVVGAIRRERRRETGR